ncbi:MAG: hypothetical protein WKG00_33630 [Polyangiaceae bacterium]
MKKTAMQRARPTTKPPTAQRRISSSAPNEDAMSPAVNASASTTSATT